MLAEIRSSRVFTLENLADDFAAVEVVVRILFRLALAEVDGAFVDANVEHGHAQDAEAEIPVDVLQFGAGNPLVFGNDVLARHVAGHRCLGEAEIEGDVLEILVEEN